jgi:LysM repeat protein
LDVPPVDAGLRVVAGRVEATPSQVGRALDVAATMAWLKQNAARVFMEGRLPLVMVPVQPAITETSAVVAQASQLLANPLSIHAYDPITDETLAWTVTPDVWGTWLSLGVDPADSTQLDWELDTEEARAFLAEQATMLGSDRYLVLDKAVTAVRETISTQGWDVPLRIVHHERQHIVQSGDTLSKLARDYGIPYPWIQQANPGMGDTLYAGQALTIPSPDALLPLPVVENKRIVVSLGEQKMWVYENGAVKWEWPVSTGIPSSPTAPGVFQVQTHEPNAYASKWDLWMPHFLGIYQPVPASDFMNGFHGFPTRGGSRLLWTGDLGHPVTYGCILVSTENAVALYEWAEEGVVVEVRP